MNIEEFFIDITTQNTSQDYEIAAGIFFGSLLLMYLFKFLILARLRSLAKQTRNGYDDIIIEFFDDIPFPFYAIISLFLSGGYLELPASVDKALDYLLLIGLVFYLVKAATRVIGYMAECEANRRRRTDGKESSLLLVMSKLIQVSVWAIAVLLVLSNLGLDITSLIAGIGLGGIAIAFALQKILEDIFSSFSIYFDKPFEEGDFIIVGNDMGVVKRIGLKSTRIQTLQGQELVMSNQELTSTRINNYKKMEKRRIVFSFGVLYETEQRKLQKIKKIVSDIIGAIKLARLDRVHFKEFGSFSLNYEVVYYLDSSDYNKFMDVQEEINMELKKAFEKEKIEFAYPTQKIFLSK